MKEDHNALLEFIRDDLYRNIKPVSIKVDELFQMQVHIVKNIHDQEQQRYKVSLNIGVITIVISIVLCVSLMLQLKRFRVLLKSF